MDWPILMVRNPDPNFESFFTDVTMSSSLYVLLRCESANLNLVPREVRISFTSDTLSIQRGRNVIDLTLILDRRSK